MESFKSWRNKKAQEIKEIPDHKERSEVWKRHKKDDVPFLYTYEPEYKTSRFDNEEAKNHDFFRSIRMIGKGLDDIYNNGELLIDYDSEKQQLVFFQIAEYIGKIFGDSGLKEFESIGLRICLKFFLQGIKSKIKPDLNLVEDYDKYINELIKWDSHMVSKIIGVFFPMSERYGKIREIYSKHYLYFREKVNNGDFDTEDRKQMVEYNDAVLKVVDELLENDEMKFNLSDELSHFKNMVTDLKSKISKDISKA